MIVVAATGSHSTGKTTLINRLYEDLSKEYDVEKIEDLAREVADLGSVKAQIEIYEKMFNEVMSKSCEVLLMDRSFLDVVAYCMHNGWMFGWSKNDFVVARDLVSDLLEAERVLVDYRIFCPIDNFELVDDGFRFTDEVGRCVVDVVIYSLLEAGRFEYTVYRKDYNEILRNIKNYLESVYDEVE